MPGEECAEDEGIMALLWKSFADNARFNAAKVCEAQGIVTFLVHAHATKSGANLGQHRSTIAVVTLYAHLGLHRR
jgi:hypothetical protein